ncbi:type II toxin-antitoxin system MqsR family toxin [Pseudoduganella sp.]|uniref:type II toxin-antitoxin system MqsR family toxin n=1 Tax=Pseudoduganella sp. TaxID=1880898 RepID=UPI0035AD81B2
MEKRTPHWKLSFVHDLVRAGRVRATLSASTGAGTLEIYSLRGMCEVVLSLSRNDFHKSMTSSADHRVWQDVYHGRTRTGRAAYVKLTVIDDVLIISFKEL